MRSLFLLLALVLLASGCRVQTDLGRQCVLVRRDPASSPGEVRAKALTEAEVPPGRDYISFGVTECEDFICVRDASYVVPANTPPTAEALGYCSRACEQQRGDSPNLNTSCPAMEEAHNRDPALRLSCRALLLDPDTITAICNADRTLCERYFGDNRFSTFCARGQTR